MAVATSTNGPAAADELLPALHEEIARLPEKYRLAVVHCDLEGMTQAQAAAQLHWSRRTLQLRLAEGRARLRRRLARRGPGAGRRDAGCGVAARGASRCSGRPGAKRPFVPRSPTVNHAVTVGVVSAAAQQLAQEVFKIMLLRKLTWASAALLAAGLIGWGASAALVSLGQEAPKGATRHGIDRPANGRDRRSAAETGLRRHGRHIPGSRAGARPRRQAGGRRRGLRASLMPNVVGARTTRWPRGRRGVWRRPMRTAGSISSWTRVRAMARTGAA